MLETNTANANELTMINTPNNSQAFILVDKIMNQGYLLDYNKLVDAIIDKIISPNMSDTGMKLYFIE